MKQDISKYNRGWKECQPGEQKRMAKADDEAPRGGNPWAGVAIIGVMLCALVMFAIGARDIGAHVHEAGQLPVVAAKR